MSYLQHLAVGNNTLRGPCVFCNKEYVITFDTVDELHDGIVLYFIHNKLMQNAFPNTSDDAREFMISGVCPDCWAETFPKEKEEDDVAEVNEILLTYLHTQESEEVFEEVDDFKETDSFIGDAIEDFLPTEWPIEIDEITPTINDIDAIDEAENK